MRMSFDVAASKVVAARRYLNESRWDNLGIGPCPGDLPRLELPRSKEMRICSNVIEYIYFRLKPHTHILVVFPVCLVAKASNLGDYQNTRGTEGHTVQQDMKTRVFDRHSRVAGKASIIDIGGAPRLQSHDGS